jgi:hypothetical protein
MLVETGDTEAIDVFLSEDDAELALAECIVDKPGWRGLLRVQEIEVDSLAAPSLN